MPDKSRIMQNFEEIEINRNQCTEYFNRVIGFVEDIVVSEEFQVIFLITLPITSILAPILTIFYELHLDYEIQF